MPSPARGLTQPQRVEASALRLVQAAAQLITEKGWEATTAAEIGRRAGYSRAMVHARYGGKDAILDTLFRSTYETQPSADLGHDLNGLQQAVGHFTRVIELYDSDREFLRAMFVLTFEAVKSTSPVRSRLQDWLTGGADNVRDGLRSGVADGSVRVDVDVESATADISTAGLGMAHHWMVFGDGHPLDEGLKSVRGRIIRDYGTSPGCRPMPGDARRSDPNPSRGRSRSSGVTSLHSDPRSDR